MSKKLKIHLALLTVSLIYGATFSIAKEVMAGFIRPNGFILLRVAVACVLLFLVHSLLIRERVAWKHMPSLAISAFFGAAANMLLFFKGLDITTPINAAVLMMITPVFVLLLSALWKKERLPARVIVGCLIAAAGAMLLMGGRQLQFSASTWLGDLYIILNAISYAIYLVYVRKMMKLYHPLTVSYWNFVYGLIFVLPFGFSELVAVDWPGISGKIWGYLVFITVGTTFLTYILNAYALRYASPSLVGSYIYLQPVFATFIALLSGTDSVSIEKMLFILLIFAGVFLVSKSSKLKADGN